MQNEERFELEEPGPMIPPVPAIVMGVAGDEEVPDDLTIVWTFVLEGSPPQVGVSVGKESAISGESQVALPLLSKHGNFTLNVSDASWLEKFDRIDMCASEKDDKFDRVGLNRLPSKKIESPGIKEAPIVIECEVISGHDLPPNRKVFFAQVVRNSVQQGVTDEKGKLIPQSRDFFGMVAGCGEFWTMGEKVGRIGQTEGIDDIRY